jgi:hypothetical protein
LVLPVAREGSYNCTKLQPKGELTFDGMSKKIVCGVISQVNCIINSSELQNKGYRICSFVQLALQQWAINWVEKVKDLSRIRFYTSNQAN